MHPYHLEVMAAERRRELIAEADRHHLTRHARRVAAIGPRRRVGALVAFDALAAYARRCRRKLRVAFAADRSYLLDDRPVAGSSVPLLMWRKEAPRNREPNRGF
jgi:hypothetical protein